MICLARLKASRRLAIGAAMAALLGGTALAPSPATAQAPVVKAPPGPPEKIKIGVLRFVSSGGLFTAVERGYFKAQGLDVELVFFDAAQPIAVAIVSGGIDFGVTAFTAGFFNLAGKGALKILAAQAKEQKGYEGNAILASNAAWEKGFRDVSQFPGKSLGITQVGSSFHYQIGQIAALKGFDLKSVDIKPLQQLPAMVAALKTNQVDSIIIAPHLAKPLIAAGDAKLLGWYSDFDEYQFGGLFTASALATTKRSLVEKVVGAYRHGQSDYAEAFLRRGPDGKRVFDAKSDAVAAIIAKYVYPSDPPADGIAKVKASAIYADPLARLDVADIVKQVNWLKSQNLVDASIDPMVTMDLTYLDDHLNVPKKQ